MLAREILEFEAESKAGRKGPTCTVRVRFQSNPFGGGPWYADARIVYNHKNNVGGPGLFYEYRACADGETREAAIREAMYDAAGKIADLLRDHLAMVQQLDGRETPPEAKEN